MKKLTNVLSGKIITQHDVFCSQVTRRIENSVLRTRRLVIGRSKRFNAHLHCTGIHKRLMSVCSQLSGEVRCYTPTQTRAHHCYINLCSIVLRREENQNLKQEVNRFFLRTRSILDNSESLIT